SRIAGGRKPCRASSTVSKNARLTARNLTLGVCAIYGVIASRSRKHSDAGAFYGVVGQRLAQVLPASAEQTRPLPAGAASTRSLPSDTIDDAPLASAVSLPTCVQVLPLSRVTYTPPVVTPLASVLNRAT